MGWVWSLGDAAVERVLELGKGPEMLGHEDRERNLVRVAGLVRGANALRKQRSEVGMLPVDGVDSGAEHEHLRFGWWLGTGIRSRKRLLTHVEGTKPRPTVEDEREEDAAHGRGAGEVLGRAVRAVRFDVEREVRASGRAAVVGVDQRGACDVQSESLDLGSEQPHKLRAARRR